MPKDGGTAPVTCPDCNKTFSKRDHLVRHARSHTGAKPYTCPVCGKSYARSDVARRHVAAHGKQPDLHQSSPHLDHTADNNSAISGPSESSSSSPQSNHMATSHRARNYHGNSTNHTMNPEAVQLDHAGVDLLGNLSLDNAPMSAAANTNHMQMDQKPNITTGRNEDAQLLANLSSTTPQSQRDSAAPFFYQSATGASPHMPNLEGPYQPQPGPTGATPMLQEPVPALDNTEWDQQLRDIFEGYNSFNNTFSPNPSTNVLPIGSDLTDASQFFDFSVLLSPEGACNRMSNMRPHTPPPQPANISPAEKLMNIWPTRPSRRSRKSNAAVAAASSAPSNGQDHNGWQGHNGYNAREVDPSTAQRMYAHLQGGGIPFTKPVPPAETLTDLLALYFEYVHPIWPMLHPPTFSPATSSSLLMLNMVALGALFLKNQEGDELAAAIMEKMHESLSFCMSAQLELYLDPADQDVLALTQAYMMRQLYWLCSGNRNQLEATQLFHSTVANVARRGNLFAPDAVEELDKSAESRPQDVEAEWRSWVATEVRRRTALCFMLNDLTFAVTFMVPPYLTVGSIAWSLPASDDLFEARSAQEWQYARQMSDTLQSVPLYTSASSLFSHNAEATLREHANSSFALHLLVGSITSVVLSTRVSRPNLESELAMEPKAQAPVTNALTAAFNVLTMSGESDNRFYTLVMWHWCYIHLLCDLRMIELACGREGPEVAKKAAARAGPWATSPAARRAVLHCVAILQIAKAATVGSEVPPHLYIALYQAWMILRTFARFFPHVYLPRSVRWGVLGAFGASSDLRKAPTTSIPDADAVEWIKNGNEASSLMGVKLNRAMHDILETMRRVGYTKLRLMLSEVVEAIEQADSAHVGQYPSGFNQ